MEKRKPLVKNLTKAFTFALCCILSVGVLSLPINATIVDGWSVNGATVVFEASPTLLPDLDDIFKYQIVGAPTTTGQSISQFRASEWDYYGGQVYEIVPPTPTYKYNIYGMLPAGYVMSKVYVTYDGFDGIQLVAPEDTTEAIIYEIRIGVGAEIIIDIESDGTSLLETPVQFRIEFLEDYEPPNNEMTPEEAFQAGYDKGYQDGKAEGNFLSIITDPIGALFNITIVEIDGTIISLGTVFFTIVGISLMLWFLKYFAGG